MCNSKRRILNILSKEISIQKEELESRIKSKKVDAVINWLLKYQYINPELVGSEKLTITEKGEEFRQQLNKQINTFILIIIGLPAAIVALFTIPQKFSKAPVDKDYDNVIKPIGVEAKDTTFFIKDYYSYNGLVDTIEKKSNFVNSISSKRNFEITYSGDILLVRENYYCYSGGNLVIKFNGNTVRNFDSLRIGRTIPDGTLKNEITEELDRRVTEIIINNKKLLAKEIISILDN